MTKNEFENKIKNKNYSKKSYKESFFHKVEYYVDYERFHIVACYRNQEKKYVVYFKDFERNVVKELGKYDTEQEAYDGMWNFIENN